MGAPMALFFFVDGLGLPPDPDDPLYRGPLGPFLAAARPLGAALGVPGLPQSATGQTALLTGKNAARLLGHHHGPYPGPRLRALLAEHGLGPRLVRAGRGFLHANGYRPDYLRARRRRSAFAAMAELAGVGLLPLKARPAVDPLLAEPEREAKKLADLAAAYPLVTLEFWATDLAGHRAPERLPELYRRLARALAVLTERGDGVLVSDHGNAEEPGHRRHTRNPVPLLAWGRLETAFAGARSILEVAPRLARALGLENGNDSHSQI